jgi:hypothetical protein
MIKPNHKLMISCCIIFHCLPHFKQVRIILFIPMAPVVRVQPFLFEDICSLPQLGHLILSIKKDFKPFCKKL